MTHGAYGLKGDTKKCLIKKYSEKWAGLDLKSGRYYRITTEISQDFHPYYKIKMALAPFFYGPYGPIEN